MYVEQKYNWTEEMKNQYEMQTSHNNKRSRKSLRTQIGE